MTRTEFAAAMAWLEAGVGRPICEGGEQEKLARMTVYYEMLSDLPLNALQAACRRATLENNYSAFPTIALLRQLATSIVAGPDLTFAEAWRHAINATASLSTETDPGYQIIRAGKKYSPAEYNQKIFAELPPTVAKAMKCFGIGRLWEDETCRAQFRRMFDEITEQERSELVLPPSLASAIAAIGEETKHKQLPSEEVSQNGRDFVRAIAGNIGVAC